MQFDDIYVEEYALQVGARLLTINIYVEEQLTFDLKEGPKAYHRYGNFAPLIAEFLSDDLGKIEERKKEINEEEWQRTEELGTKFMKSFLLNPRGWPIYCSRP